MGAVSHCAGSELSVPELTVPIKYRPRGAEGYAPPLTDPVVECLGLTLVDLEGRVIVDNLCDRFDAVVRDYGVDVRVRDARICVDCALTGRGSDGALFRISHPKSDTLTAMQPTVMSLECDLDAVDDIEGVGDVCFASGWSTTRAVPDQDVQLPDGGERFLQPTRSSRRRRRRRRRTRRP